MRLAQILELVGSLDDTAGEQAPRERFRTYLKSSISRIGEV